MCIRSGPGSIQTVPCLWLCHQRKICKPSRYHSKMDWLAPCPPCPCPNIPPSLNSPDKLISCVLIQIFLEHVHIFILIYMWAHEFIKFTAWYLRVVVSLFVPNTLLIKQVREASGKMFQRSGVSLKNMKKC